MIEVRLEQFWKAFFSILVRPDDNVEDDDDDDDDGGGGGSWIDDRQLQSKNVFSDIFVREEGRRSVVRLLQFANALGPILTMESGRVMEVR